MCDNSVPSVNLQTAVLMQVQEFANSGQCFSRYDITKALRQKCNDGLLEIPEVENVNPGSIRFDIRKDAVDAIFEQLYQNCLANGLPPLKCDYNRQLGYRVFAVDTSAVQTPPTPTVQLASFPPSVPLPTNLATSPVPPTQVVNIPVLDDSELRRRVTQYMDGCTKIGKTPTLKQIQSAIKRGNKSTGLSYREIANVATSLGYNL